MATTYPILVQGFRILQRPVSPLVNESPTDLAPFAVGLRDHASFDKFPDELSRRDLRRSSYCVRGPRLSANVYLDVWHVVVAAMYTSPYSRSSL